MSGPEHYREAERLLDAVKETARTLDALPALANKSQVALETAPVAANLLAQAQAHATLALVAATVATRAFGPQEPWGGHSIECDGEWQQVTS